jgi:hypothetical protein
MAPTGTYVNARYALASGNSVNIEIDRLGEITFHFHSPASKADKEEAERMLPDACAEAGLDLSQVEEKRKGKKK